MWRSETIPMQKEEMHVGQKDDHCGQVVHSKEQATEASP
jgi:hypothetical protein